jgi:hypothetical protein
LSKFDLNYELLKEVHHLACYAVQFLLETLHCNDQSDPQELPT